MRTRSIALALLTFSSASLVGDTWTSVGAFGGQTATAVAFNGGFMGPPGSYLYAATDGSGVFRSGDLGVTWAPAAPGLTNTHVSSLAFHVVYPPNTSGCPPPCQGPGTVYAGTHGGGVFVLPPQDGASWSANNAGLTDFDVTALAWDFSGVWAGTASGTVFRNVFSFSGPQTWARSNAPVDGTPVGAIGVSPDGATIFFGTSMGLYRSRDFGGSWTKLQQLQLIDVRAIAVDFAHPGTIYAAGVTSCPSPCAAPVAPGIAKSTDGGDTWTVITGVYPTNALVVSQVGDVFAGTTSGVWRSSDGGTSWHSTGLDGIEVDALTESPFAFSESIPLAAGTVGSGVYRADIPIGGVCRPDAANLCLNSGRFRVAVSWHTRQGRQAGNGVTMPITGDSGAFWFFQPSNIELVVKVLDGRTINGHFWVFFGALTNVGYTITVTDTATGAVKTYVNVEGHLASGADTEAF